MESQGHHETSTLRAYLAVIRRRRLTFISILVAVPILAAVLSLLQTPTYEGTAEVYLSRQNLANVINGLPDPGTTTADTSNRLGQTQAELARVPPVAARALKAANVQQTPDEFLDRSSVENRPNADLLVFHVRDEDPVVAARLTTAYAQQFTLYRRELDTAAIERAQSAVDERLKTLEAAGRTHESLYRQLETKSEQLSTLAALQTSNSTLVRPSSEGTQVEPRTVRNVAIGVVLGLLLAIGVVFARDALDTRIRTPEEVGHILDVPLLGLLPAPPRRLRQGQTQAPAMLVEPQGLSAEAFRMLRINTEFRMAGAHLSRVMVASAVPAEGKSTTCTNLAVAFARAGHRVILADLDLRRPQVHRFFGLADRPGLTDVALGSAGLDDVIHEIPLHEEATRNGSMAHASLRVVPAGSLLPAPGEFIASSVMSGLLDELQTRTDILLLDTPPLLRVGDAMVLIPQVNAVLFVAHMDLIRRPMLREVRRLFETSGAPVIGYCATGTGDEQSYGYAYGYGSYASAPDATELTV